MFKQWRRYNIFISSTFKDMNTERDILKQRVIPRINEQLKDYCVELYPIDLRFGINTSNLSVEDASRKVLSECAMCIDQARPFFIGLIGGRYGWIPSEKEWRKFMTSLSEQDRLTMKDTSGMSVTELEIEYGALTRKSLEYSHTLFFMRDDSSYKHIPDEYKELYYESSPQMQAKLKGIKSRIINSIKDKGGDDDFYIKYSMEWDNDNHNLKDVDFEELSYKTLLGLILREIEDKDSNYIEDEIAFHEAQFSKRLNYYSTALPYFDKRYENSLFLGSLGCGLTSILAHQWKLYQEQTNDALLCASVGTSALSDSMDGLLVLWAYKLEQELGIEHRDANELLNATPLEIYDNFYWLVNQLAQNGRRVTIFLDDIHNFLKTSPDDIFLSFAHPKINILASSIDYSVALKVQRYNEFKHLEVETLSSKQQDKLIDVLEKRFYLEISKKARKVICKDPHLPISLVSFFRLLSFANDATFKDINKNFKEFSQGVENLIISLYKDLFTSSTSETEVILPNLLINIYGGLSGTDSQWYNRMFSYIACSPKGIDLANLEEIAYPDWDTNEWSQYTNLLQDYIYETFPNKNLNTKTEFNVFGSDEETPYNDLLDYIEFLDDNSYKEQSAAYLMLHSESKAEMFEESYLPLNKETIEMLIYEDWFSDGSLKAYIESGGLEDGDIDLLLSPVVKLLNNRLSRCMLDEQLDTLMQNLCSSLPAKDRVKLKFLNKQFNELSNENEQNALNAISQYYNTSVKAEISDLEKLLKTFNYSNIRELLSFMKESFNDNTQRITNNADLGAIILMMSSIYGFANNSQNLKHFNSEELDSISDISCFAIMIAFTRLKYLNPNNPILVKAGSIINMLDASFYDDFYYHSNYIYTCIDELNPLLNKS